MREIKYYIAYDGAEFDDRYECEVYEKEALEGMIDGGDIKFFHEDFTPYEPYSKIDGLTDSPVIWIKDRLTLNFLFCMAETFGVENLPPSEGLWVYDSSRDSGWIEGEKVVNKELKEIEDFKNRYCEIVGKEISW